jgi:hypothetical protein
MRGHATTNCTTTKKDDEPLTISRERGMTMMVG